MTQASIGHNSRSHDVKRTAEEILEKVRSDVRSKWIRPDTNWLQRWTIELLCSDLSAGAKLYGIVAKMHGNSDGASVYPSLERMQVLTSLSRPTVIKAKTDLAKAGFIEFEKKSKGRLTDLINLALPKERDDNGKEALPFQQSNSFTVEAVYGNATVKIDPSNGKAALPDLSLPCVVEGEVRHTGNATSKGLGRKEQAKGECSSTVGFNGHAQPCLAEGPQLQGLSNELSFCQVLTLKEPPLAPQHAQVVGNQFIAERLNGLGSANGVAEDGPLVYNLEPIAHNASGDLFSGSVEKLPTKEHFKKFAEIAHEFNYPPGAKIPERDHKHLQRVANGFADIVKSALEKAPRSLVLEALDFALAYTGAKGHKPQYGTGPQPALSYWRKAFKGELVRLLKAEKAERADEHAERVEAQKRQALAEIEIEGAKAANGKKLAALDMRIQIGNEAATKRIAAAEANGVNGKNAAPAAKEDGNKSGFKEWETIREMPCGFKIKGPLAMKIEKATGASSLDIRNAIDELEPPYGRGGPMSVGAEWVQTMVMKKLSGGEEPRPNIVSELVETAQCYSPQDGWVRDADIDETAKRIGATELEVDFVKQAQVVRKRRGSNYHNGHYNGETL